MDHVLKTAKSCRHYAMCKIDFLGAGVCTSGTEKHYVSFYPQGRMDLYAALVENRIPVTERCVEIVESCDLCGKCDYQCYFVTEMKPSVVMKALKELLRSYLDRGGKVLTAEKDSILEELTGIVGSTWATGDRAIALTYSHDPCPMAEPRMPRYVIMPGTTEEISEVIKLLHRNHIPYAVRGNGSSVIGLVMSEGAVIDLGRMKTIDFDEKNWLVKVGPGISAFELQKAAVERGYRVNIAEPSALVCANLACTGIFSTFSASYGTAADNYIDAEFVGPDGRIFQLSDKSAPNLFAFSKEGPGISAICASADIRLHPIPSEEGAAFVPFDSLERALDLARECALRRIGSAIAVVGGEYLSVFLSPTKKLAVEVKATFSHKLKIQYLVLVIGDKYALKTIREMGYNYFDNRLFRIFNLGLPSLTSAKWLDLIDELAPDESFSYLGLKSFPDLAEAALAPSAGQLVQDVDPDLRPFFEHLYERPEMSDPVWLNMFRIISSRMGREKHALAIIIYLPIDPQLISGIRRELKRIADSHSLKNDYGFITPLDHGKRCVFEYDYYLDPNDPDERRKMQKAMEEAGIMIEKVSAETGTVTWIKHVLCQGFSRKEGFLYSGAVADRCPGKDQT